MATFRKRNGKWQVQVRRAGQPPISKTFLTKADGNQWAREKETEADRLELSINSEALRNTTLKELVERYVKEITPQKRSARAETYVLRAFLLHPICRKFLTDLRPTDFARYRDQRLLKMSPSGLKRELVSIRHIFEVARDEWGLPIRENPLDKVKLKATDIRRERRLREGEYERLLEAARSRQNHRIEKVIIFAIETAMRRGEILKLRWDQVDMRRRCVTILESKNGYSRTIPLTPTAIALLHSCRGDAGGNNLVFPLTANALKMAWGRMLKQAGIKDLHFHDLRHEAISRFFEMGLTVPEVASISGHRNSAMLSRYGHAQMSRIHNRFHCVE